ncbi:hypothetical protein AVEN_86550-1 [Araneus ventricosus]|uniref:Gustatory receptor n=1 Tax=Araneus ventricosus TaxID=182803 RepID=A0A4Y2G131_ARAVE|nr:hypothetical protein AVEN_86550-1 [Araneus ventricosus]
MAILNLENSACKKLCLKTIKVSPNSESSKMSLIKCETIIPKFLQVFLFLTGLIEMNIKNKRYKKAPVIFGALLLFANMDNLAILFVGIKHLESLQSFIAYVFTYTLAALLWFIMHLRRKKLTDLLYKFQKLSISTHYAMVNLLTAILCCMPFVFAAIILILVSENHATFFTYGYAVKEQWLQIVIIYIKNCIYTFIFPTFPNLVALFYCATCIRSSYLIKLLSDEIVRCSPHSFTSSKRIKIVRQKSKIDDILDSIQDIFSLPSFIIIILNLAACFSLLGLYLDMTSMQARGVIFIVEWALYAGNAIAGLVLTLWIAGYVPIEDSRFKEEFYKKMKMRMLLLGLSEEMELEKWIITRPEFAFTGWNILSYRRSSVFALVGTLLTYTFLVVR